MSFLPVRNAKSGITLQKQIAGTIREGLNYRGIAHDAGNIRRIVRPVKHRMGAFEGG